MFICLKRMGLCLVLVWMKAFLYDVQQTHGQHMYRTALLPRQGADDDASHPVLPDLSPCRAGMLPPQRT